MDKKNPKNKIIKSANIFDFAQVLEGKKITKEAIKVN